MKRRYAEAILRRELHVLDMGQAVVLCTKAEWLNPPAIVKSIGETAEIVPYCKNCIKVLLDRVTG